jgi:hypothetical protein
MDRGSATHSAILDRQTQSDCLAPLVVIFGRQFVSDRPNLFPEFNANSAASRRGLAAKLSAEDVRPFGSFTRELSNGVVGPGAPLRFWIVKIGVIQSWRVTASIVRTHF